MNKIEQLKFSDFKLVYYIGQYKNLTRAGAALFLSQPATSLKFKQIEEVIGQEIATRKSRNIQLNSLGLLLAKHYQLQRNLLDELSDAINSPESDVDGTVTIGCSDTIAIHILPKLVRKMTDSYPNLKLNITSKPSRVIAQEVLDGKVDFGVALNNSLTKRFEQIPLFQREDCLVVSEKHALANQKEASLEQFRGHALITLDAASQSRHFIVDWFKKRDIEIDIRMELASIEMIKRYVELDYGFTIIPRFAVRSSENLSALKIMNDVPFGIVSVFYDKRKYQNRLSKVVIDKLIEMYANIDV
jgi:DNA-binding transcriptional LysR family regulator